MSSELRAPKKTKKSKSKTTGGVGSGGGGGGDGRGKTGEAALNAVESSKIAIPKHSSAIAVQGRHSAFRYHSGQRHL